MQNEASYIKDSNGFINKVKNIDVTNDALLVNADAVRLNSCILHEVGLKALRNALENMHFDANKAAFLKSSFFLEVGGEVNLNPLLPLQILKRTNLISI